MERERNLREDLKIENFKIMHNFLKTKQNQVSTEPKENSEKKI